jgi:hypothetical protein
MTQAKDLVEGDIVVERSERSTITFRGRVVETGPCSDFGNVHVNLRGVGPSTGGNKTGCYFREMVVEMGAKP